MLGLKSILLFSLFFPIFLLAQVDTKEDKSSPIYYGSSFHGKVGLSTNTGSVAPFVGYKLSERISLGLESSYETSFGRNRSVDLTFFSLSAFTRIKLIYNTFSYCSYGLYHNTISPRRNVWGLESEQKSLRQYLNLGLGYRTPGTWGFEARLNYNINKYGNYFRLLAGFSRNF